MNNKNAFNKMFEEYGVDGEDALFDKMVKDSETIPCSICGKERSLEKEELRFLDGEPVCIYCLEKI